MTKKNLALAVVAGCGIGRASAQAITESVKVWNLSQDLVKSVYLPMPPEVARKAERDQWKMVRKHGR